jgi:acyl transferase domain-containing protein
MHESLLTAVGKLHSLNVPIHLKSLVPSGSCLPDLPRYPWNHENSYWYETRLSKEWRLRKYPYHDLLAVRLPESTDIEPVWRNMLHLQNGPWLRDHKVAEDIVFPFAGYVALAGEAVRQVSEIDEGFSLRNITVSTALVLPEGKPTEIMTTFRQHRLTTSLNSQWWEFTIVSFNGHVWTKHCTGEAMALSSSLGPAREPDVLPRKVGARKWYETMRRVGLDLGPSFQTLETVETSTNTANQATGRVINGRQGDEANYHIHPTVFDGTLQLLGAASVNGYSRKHKNWLPTTIDKLSVTRCSSDMVSSVSARATSNTSVVGEGRCTSEGFTVLEVSGIRISLAEGSLSTNTHDAHAAARYEWSSDIDFMDPKELIKAPTDQTRHMVLLDELSQLCLFISKRSLSGLETQLDHTQKYIAWINSQAQSKDLLAASSLDNETVSARIEGLLHRLSDTPAAPAATALHQVCTKIDLLLSGHTLEDILSDEIMTNLYRFIDQRDRSEFVRHLGHSKPNLRILEIGTGRGSRRVVFSRILLYLRAKFFAPSTPSLRRASFPQKTNRKHSRTWSMPP